MSKEPVKTVNNKEPGRPVIAEEQYKEWLDDMKPYLRLGNTLHYSIRKAGLIKFSTTIYEKYRLNDWFSEKVDVYRAEPGEIINNIFTRHVKEIGEKIRQERPIDSTEWQNMRWFAEKHRSAQPFFVTRTETAVVDESTVGKILDGLETDYDELGQKAQKQIMETNPPVQDKDQGGEPQDVQAEPDTVATPSGQEGAPVQQNPQS